MDDSNETSPIYYFFRYKDDRFSIVPLGILTLFEFEIVIHAPYLPLTFNQKEFNFLYTQYVLKHLHGSIWKIRRVRMLLDRVSMAGTLVDFEDDISLEIEISDKGSILIYKLIDYYVSCYVNPDNVNVLNYKFTLIFKDKFTNDMVHKLPYDTLINSFCGNVLSIITLVDSDTSPEAFYYSINFKRSIYSILDDLFLNF